MKGKHFATTGIFDSTSTCTAKKEKISASFLGSIGALVMTLLMPTASRAAVIAPTFGMGFSSAEKEVINAAIEWWSIALPDLGLNANPVAVNFVKLTFENPFILAAATPLTSTGGVEEGGGVAGDLFLGRPASAIVEISNTFDFFVDETPHDESEFTPVPTNDPNPFDDNNPFFFNQFEGNSGDAATKFDLLTLMKHELGHVLGWDGDFRLFRDWMDGLFVGNDLDNEIMSANFGLLTLEGDGQDNSLNESTSDNINELSHLRRDVYPNDLMNPILGPGIRRLQSPLDIDVLGQVYGYQTNLNPVHAVPEPSSLFSLLILGALGAGSSLLGNSQKKHPKQK